jgi:hypothetical protein
LSTFAFVSGAFEVLLRKPLFQCLEGFFFCIFSSRIFTVFLLIFISLIHLELIFVLVRYRGQVFSFADRDQIFFHHLLKSMFAAPIHVSGTFADNPLAEGV